jgi:hypothetical protein
MKTSSTSGMSVGQRWRNDSRSLRHLLGREPAQPEAPGLEVHLHEHAEEVHEGGDGRRGDDRLVGQREELDHQEGGRAEHGRRDLPAGGGGSLHRRLPNSRL